MSDLKGVQETHPFQSNLFHFHTVFKEIWPNNGLVPSPWDPGSATEKQN